jgi:H+/Cl- antiporter ClcA
MSDNDAPKPGATPSPFSGLDVAAVLWSRGYFRLLLLSAVIGVVISVVSWCYLNLVIVIQHWVYEDLPSALGFAGVPWWWPLPILLVAGLLVAVAIGRLPGRGGHDPSQGLHAGPPAQPITLPGVLLASLASLGLGLVLGPEAPLIALGSGLTLLALQQAKKAIPDRAQLVLTSAASFAAISTVFGNPLIGAIIIIEAAGLGGPALPLVLLPGLTAAGIGSLVFIGMGDLSGLSTSAYALPPVSLPAYSNPTLGDFGWTIVLAVVVAVAVVGIMQIGQRTGGLVTRRPFVVVPAAALLVAALAIVFARITGVSANAVLFSGQEAMTAVIEQSATWSLATLAVLLVCKGLAWGLSLGAARGGPTFPAIFLGLVAGLLAGHLPGFAETPAVAVLIGVACVSILRLPLSSVVIAVLISRSGMSATPLIIVGVVVAYVAATRLSALKAQAPGVPPNTDGVTDRRTPPRSQDRA